MNDTDLLAAGAVLPLTGEGTPGAGSAAGKGGKGGTVGADGTDAVDVLVARGYGHPALDERVVVRLVPEALGEAEDLSLEYLGFEARGGERVGRVQRRSLGFPAWALVHDPANGRHALAVVKEMERLTRLASTRPGYAKEGFDEIAVRLDRSVPHFLPTYYEQVARIFLGAESTTYASQLFNKAREAESRHALAVDEERLREVFLEFAAAGALSGKALRDQAKGLAERLTPEAAFEQFRILCLERAAAGLTPYAGMVEDFRRLAKAAGRDTRAEETSLVAELLGSGSITRSPMSFWKAARAALVEAATGSREVAARLLHVFPSITSEHATEFDGFWLGLLTDAGAFELLAGKGAAGTAADRREGEAGAGTAAGEAAPRAAEWFSRWAQHRRRGGYWSKPGRIVAELELVERFAAQLAAEGEPVRLIVDSGYRSIALDLLDTCLAAGVPVADPHEERTSLDLAGWLSDETPGGRDLAAVAADPRFAPLLGTAVEGVSGTSDGPAALLRLAGHPVLGPVVGRWLADRAGDLDRPLGLPGLDQQLTRVAHFADPAVLATAPEAAARIAAFDVAPVLGHTLRAGILDELGWPALEEAVARLKPSRGKGQQQGNDWFQLEDAWPALLVACGTHVVAVGPDGVLDERTLTLPATNQYSWNRTALRWVDGQWLIASGYGDERRAAWSGSPADVFKPKGTLEAPYRGTGPVSLALPSGGRFHGTRPVLAGDTSFGDRRDIASDGLSYWVLHERRWYEYDTAAANRGRASVPSFFDGALTEAGAGAAGAGPRLVESACRLLPVQPGLEGSPFGSKDGLLGWWVRHDQAAGTLSACSVDGSRGPVRSYTGEPDPWRIDQHGTPLPPLRLPGGAVLHPVVRNSGWTASVDFSDSEGTQLAHVEESSRGGHYMSGTEIVPPLWHWHALRPRDEEGSAVLRAVTDEQAAALLAELPNSKADATAAVRKVLPGITNDALVKGVASLVRRAAHAARRISAFAVRRTAPVKASGRTVVHAFDAPLTEALSGLMTDVVSFGYYSSGPTTDTIDALRALAAVVGGAAEVPLPEREPKGNGPLGVSRPPIPRQRTMGWLSLLGAGLSAAAARAAAPGTSQEHRAALLEFLETALAVVAGTEGAPAPGAAGATAGMAAVSASGHTTGLTTALDAAATSGTSTAGTTAGMAAVSGSGHAAGTDLADAAATNGGRAAASAGGGSGPDRVAADPRGRLRVVLVKGRTADDAAGRGGNRSPDRAGELHRSGGRTLLLVAPCVSHDDRKRWRALEYAPDGVFGPWEGLTLTEERVAGAPDEPGRAAGVARLVALIRERGPVPYRAQAAERFAELTGIDVSVAALLLLGIPALDGYGRDSLPSPETLELAGLRPTRAATARLRLRQVSTADRVRLLAALVPADPAAAERLWEDGFDADALAEEWIAVHGRQRAVPIELEELADRELPCNGFLPRAVNAGSRPELTGRTRQVMEKGRLTVEDANLQLTGGEIRSYVETLRWLAYRLPFGDPLRAALPETLRALRTRLADEGLLLDLGVDWTSEGESTAVAVRTAHGLAESGGADPDGMVRVGPALVLTPMRYGQREEVWVRPAALLPETSPEGGADHPTLALIAGLVPAGQQVRALRELLGEELAALLTVDGRAGCPQSPEHSVPELVAEAAERLGLSADAAALYLMLLALPDPTDRRVNEWTGWKPARAKRARAELAATDLVVEAKRARAGRTLFLPGGWLDLKSPRLPIETWKAALFRTEQVASDCALLPDEPVADLFRRAWQRVVAGDAPGFEEFKARRGRGGRGRR